MRDVPRVIITDPLKSDEAARQAWMPGIEHRQHPRLNHHAALSHPPTRQRERPMPWFRSPGHAQRVLSAHGPMNHLFCPRRHRMAAAEYHAVRIQAFDTG
ncbi:MAG: IS6 family transposase [Candidatus Competibacteraceae bacterium]|nr:IS6 family transposase [Candidatus Competibacteraceae bacterium]